MTLDHVLALDGMPAHHKDPFDRLLLAQSTVEDVVLVGKDSVFTDYPVNSDTSHIHPRQRAAATMQLNPPTCLRLPTTLAV